MTDNPYESPRASAALESSPPPPRPPRPLGVRILAALHILGGLALLVFEVMQWIYVTPMADVEWARAALFGMFARDALVCLLAFGSGIGLWFGATWGWWLAGLFYMQAIFGQVGRLIAYAEVAGGLDPATVIWHIVLPSAWRIVVSLLLCAYLLKHNVRAYFFVAHLSTPKALAILLGLAIALSIAFATFVFLAQQSVR
jgi:hypothetical protein